MSFAYRWNGRGIVVTYSDSVVAQDVLQCHQQIASDARFSDLRWAIVDTLAVRSIALAPSDVVDVDAFLKGPAWTNANIRVAVVATRPDVLRVLSYYNAIADHSYNILICDSVQEARRLIGAGP